VFVEIDRQQQDIGIGEAAEIGLIVADHVVQADRVAADEPIAQRARLCRGTVDIELDLHSIVLQDSDGGAALGKAVGLSEAEDRAGINDPDR